MVEGSDPDFGLGRLPRPLRLPQGWFLQSALLEDLLVLLSRLRTAWLPPLLTALPGLRGVPGKQG